MDIAYSAICSTAARSTKCVTRHKCRCFSFVPENSCRGACAKRLFPRFGARRGERRYNNSEACSISRVPLLQTNVKVCLLTNEYPPHIYGGAGVHVDHMSRELAKTIEVDVRCFGDQHFKKGKLKVTGFEVDEAANFTCPKPLQSVFGAVRRCIDFNTTNIDADLVHCHTWYSHFGGILAKLNYGIPLVITTHSLEPMRPWKREQLAAGYDFSVLLCAGAPDTPEIATEMQDAVAQAKTKRSDIIWVEEMVDRETVVELYSHAAVFCCPSIYEPFGIINLEAMACETAVVASAVGGIKEVVVDGETGFLVPLEQMKESPFEAINPEKFARDLAQRVNELMRDRQLRERFEKAGRKRVEKNFSWAAIAEKTSALYASLLSSLVKRSELKGTRRTV